MSSYSDILESDNSSLHATDSDVDEEEPHRHEDTGDDEEAQTPLSRKQKETDSSDEEVDEVEETASKKRKRTVWSDSDLDDIVDIVVNDEYLKKRLIFMNAKKQKNTEYYGRVRDEMIKRNKTFSYSPVQIRNKFKKMVAESKKVSLTLKTATGIDRFMEESNHGQWFKQLFPIVKCDACDPEMAVEPSTHKIVQSADEESDYSKCQNKEKSGRKFVPTPENSAKKRKAKEGKKDEMLDMMKKLTENDPTESLFKFFKEDQERAREHELKLFSMLLKAPVASGASHGPGPSSVPFANSSTAPRPQMNFYPEQGHSHFFHPNPVPGPQSYQPDMYQPYGKVSTCQQHSSGQSQEKAPDHRNFFHDFQIPESTDNGKEYEHL